MNMKELFSEIDRPEVKTTLKCLVDITPDGRIDGIRPMVNTDREFRVVEKAMAPLLREAVGV